MTAAGSVERTVARVLGVSTTLGVALAGLGTAWLLVTGTSPLDVSGGAVAVVIAGLRVDPGAIIAAGVVALVAGPTLRVAAAIPGYVGRGERMMSGVSVAVLGVIALAVFVAGKGT